MQSYAFDPKIKLIHSYQKPPFRRQIYHYEQENCTTDSHSERVIKERNTIPHSSHVIRILFLSND